MEGLTRRPAVILSLEVSLSQEMARIESEACDCSPRGLVVRAGWVQTKALQTGAQRNAGSHRIDELIVRPRTRLAWTTSIGGMPEVGFEPTRAFAHDLLRIASLPFLHSGSDRVYPIIAATALPLVTPLSHRLSWNPRGTRNGAVVQARSEQPVDRLPF
jgi:hypothetical protein